MKKYAFTVRDSAGDRQLLIVEAYEEKFARVQVEYAVLKGSNWKRHAVQLKLKGVA